MRFGRIATPEGMTFAVIDNEGETAKAIAGTPFTEPEYTGKKYALDDVRLLAPTLPSKVVAVGRNLRVPKVLLAKVLTGELSLVLADEQAHRTPSEPHTGRAVRKPQLSLLDQLERS